MSDHTRLSKAEEESLEKDLLKEFAPIKKENAATRVLVIDGLPQTGKVEKLTKMVRKKFAEFGRIVDFSLATGENGETTGCGFAQFASEEGAQAAQKGMMGHKLDKTHVLSVDVLQDVLDLDTLPETLGEESMATVDLPENLNSWLEDERACEQYVIRYEDKTEIYWNEQKGASKAELVYGRDNWTDAYVKWSPMGTYLVTIHEKGIALWGGPSWKRLKRFQHPGVTVVEFSPRENYIITFSPKYGDNDNPKDPKTIIVWDIRTGRKLRGFLNGPTPFIWSFDDRFVARLDKDKVMVYETPSMMLHDKRSLMVPGVCEFAWAPNNGNVLAYFVPEDDTSAARVVLVEFPSRTVLRTKNLFNVTGAKLDWHPEGTFLCVKVDRLKKKTPFVNFEIFRTRNMRKHKEIGVDVLEFHTPVKAFAWEPIGTRFAIVHGEGPRHNVDFYRVDKRELVQTGTLENKPVNALFWSPRGRNIVLAGLGGLNGQLEFYDAFTNETMGVDEHFMATVIEWDPAGRYVTTTVSAWRQALETGMTIFNYQGQKVHSLLRDKFFLISWRPRPPSLLNKQQVREIAENLDNYIESIRVADEEAAAAVAEEDRAKRAAAIDGFKQKVADARKRYDAAKAERIKAYGFDPDAPLADSLMGVTTGYKEVILEEVVKVL